MSIGNDKKNLLCYNNIEYRQRLYLYDSRSDRERTDCKANRVHSPEGHGRRIW